MQEISMFLAWFIWHSGDYLRNVAWEIRTWNLDVLLPASIFIIWGCFITIKAWCYTILKELDSKMQFWPITTQKKANQWYSYSLRKFMCNKCLNKDFDDFVYVFIRLLVALISVMVTLLVVHSAEHLILISSHLYVGVPSGLFLLSFMTKIL
jgi:hypothetical protein